MRVRVLQHVPFEGPAHVGVWTRRQGYDLEVSNLHHGDPLPDPDEVDWLVVLGGLMSVWEEDQYPWLQPEKQFIRECIDQGKTVLGICLGAQLIASALGAGVRRNILPEIGWHEVHLGPRARRNPLFKGWPESLLAFHWHGDTFALPDKAEPIGSSRACENQGFVYGSRVVALQFHLEYSVGSIELMLKHCGHQLDDSPFVQSPGQIRDRIDRRVHRAQGWLSQLLNNLPVEPAVKDR